MPIHKLAIEISHIPANETSTQLIILFYTTKLFFYNILCTLSGNMKKERQITCNVLYIMGVENIFG